MKLRERLFGKSSAASRPDAGAPPRPGVSREGASPERVNRLWEDAKKLGWSDGERKKAVGIYTELLTLIDEQSTEFNVCAVLRNRAIAFRSLKDYDAALRDLGRELEIAERRGDHLRQMECRKITAETEDMKRKSQIEAEGGAKASRLRTMEAQARGLWRGGAEFEAAFDALFADLASDDPDVRAEASRLLAEERGAIGRLISIYQGSLGSDPRRASVAGRVLGRKAAKGSDDMIHAQIAQMLYGISVSFIPCPCEHCGHMNRGIAAPPSAPMVPYYSQSDDEGAYAVPVLCDRCGKEFFVVWDTVPG